jgi:hypothetical protein
MQIESAQAALPRGAHPACLRLSAQAALPRGARPACLHLSLTLLQTCSASGEEWEESQGHEASASEERTTAQADRR